MAVIRIGTDSLPERDVVELFDHKFTVRRLTRDVQKALEGVDRKERGMKEDATSDEYVTILADGIDALLEPNGKATPAKKVILDAWKANEIDLGLLRQLSEQVQESATKRPPTSTPAT